MILIKYQMPVSQKFELALILKESTVLTGTKAYNGLHFIQHCHVLCYKNPIIILLMRL